MDSVEFARVDGIGGLKPTLQPADSPPPMPSEPSDGIFDAPAVYRRRAGAVKYPYRHSRYTVILKPVIPAQAGIQSVRFQSFPKIAVALSF